MSEHQTQTDRKLTASTRRVDRIGVYVFGFIVPASLVIAYLSTDPVLTAMEGIFAGIWAIGFWWKTRAERDVGHNRILNTLTHRVTRIAYLGFGAAGLLIGLSTGSVFLKGVVVLSGFLLIGGSVVYWLALRPPSQRHR